MNIKEQRLRQILQDLSSVAVAFSGGVDSSYLLACIDTLGVEQVTAVTIDSPLLPRLELATAREIARLLGRPSRGDAGRGKRRDDRQQSSRPVLLPSVFALRPCRRYCSDGAGSRPVTW